MADDFFSSTGLHREALVWAVATRSQLDRWEPLVARHVKRNFGGGDLPKPLYWQMQYERVFCLMAARSMLEAIELLEERVPVDEVVKSEIKEARDLTQHWKENMPVFNRRPRVMAPRRRSGRDFAERNPQAGPFGFWSWSSSAGAMLTPHVAAAVLHQLISDVQDRILSVSPDLIDFIPERPDSPWIEDAETSGYYPR